MISVPVMTESATAKTQQPQPMAAAENNVEPAGLEPELVAVIAAAIEAVIDAPFRITTISERRTDGTLVSLWSIEGRRSIFSSHNFR
jgi:hypothetical protein